MSESLEPTVWRSCRALANRTRLSLLKAMIDEPPMCVQELAFRCKLKKSVCSQYLRILNARGFLQASRRGRWVNYVLGANPSVKHADDLLKAVVRALRGCASDKAYARVMKDLTIFTCPKRMLIVCVIRDNPGRSFFFFFSRCRMPYQTLHRQLKKLERRGVVSWAESGITLCTPARPLAKKILTLVLEKSRDSSHS